MHHNGVFQLRGTQSSDCCQSIEELGTVLQVLESLLLTQPSYIAIVKITLCFDPQTIQKASIPSSQIATILFTSVCPFIRQTDHILIMEHTGYFLLVEANEQGAITVQQRLIEKLLWHNKQSHHHTDYHLQALHLSYSSYPHPQKTLQACLEATHQIKHTIPTERPKPLTIQTTQNNLPYLPILPRSLPTKINPPISPILARQLQCYPLGQENNTLTVAIADPQNNKALTQLHQMTGLEIYPVLTSYQELYSALEALDTDV